jgi:hypothetical protein
MVGYGREESPLRPKCYRLNYTAPAWIGSGTKGVWTGRFVIVPVRSARHLTHSSFSVAKNAVNS